MLTRHDADSSDDGADDVDSFNAFDDLDNFDVADGSGSVDPLTARANAVRMDTRRTLAPKLHARAARLDIRVHPGRGRVVHGRKRIVYLAPNGARTRQCCAR